MKELFLTRDNLTNKISYYHLLLLLASLPFDRFYSHVILISFGVHTLINLDREHFKAVFKWRTLLLQSVFFVTVVSTIYTINKPEAFNEWSKHLTIFLFPVFFCFTKLDLKKYKAPLLLGFSLVCTATIIYLFLSTIYTIRFYKLPFLTLYSGAFINHNFSEPIDMHATFFSMQVLIALVYLISVVVKEKAILYKVFYAACICILFAGLFQLCSKSVFFCLFISINLVVPFFLMTGRRWKFMLIAVCASILLVVGLLRLNIFRDRYVIELKDDLSAPKTGGETTDPRLARWDVAAELIAASPVIGHGAGSEIGLLHEAYFKKKYYSSFLNNLNVHNQYLSFMIKSGIIGLAVYLVTLVFGFRESIMKKDLLFFTFMLLLAIVSLSENFLDVDKGIFFYAFFFSFFVFSEDKKKVIIAPKTLELEDVII